MHELAITNAILKTVLKHARRERAERVHSILLLVTEISDLQPVWIQHYFDRIAAKTTAAGAELRIERRAPSFTCRACKRSFALSLQTVDRVRCTSCGSTDCTLTEEPDYVVEEIEVS